MPIDIVPTATRRAWSQPSDHGIPRDPALRALRAKVLERDQYTCQGRSCGVVARHHMEIHHLDHDHSNMALDNLATLCPWCHMAFHLPEASRQGIGEIVWLPEIQQGTLNRISMLCHMALLRSDHPWLPVAERLAAEIGQRADLAESELSIRDPERLADLMVSWRTTPAQWKAHAVQREGLSHLRLWLRPVPSSRLSRVARDWAGHERTWAWSETDGGLTMDAVLAAMGPPTS